MDRRRNHLENIEYRRLMGFYKKAKKEGKDLKAAAVAHIIYSKFGEGDYRSGYDYGNERN